MEYIDIDTDEIPYQFEIELSGEVFTLELHYNHDYDFFTVDLSKGNEALVLGEKIVYGKPLFSSVSNSKLPKVNIVPRDLNGQAQRVGWDELGVSVFLMVEAVG